MSAADQAKFTNVFGENMFVGYVLKREGSGWHIDGVLAEDPPVYVVELYDAENNGLFAISSMIQNFRELLTGNLKGKQRRFWVVRIISMKKEMTTLS